jgi:hypothetical protein
MLTKCLGLWRKHRGDNPTWPALLDEIKRGWNGYREDGFGDRDKFLQLNKLIWPDAIQRGLDLASKSKPKTIAGYKRI